MTLLRDFSASNILNSIAEAVANHLLAENYLVYWHNRSAVQTPDGIYYDWNTNYATYLVDSTFAARLSAAKGLVSLVEGLPASPTWIFRPITTAGPIGQDQLLLPVLSVEVGPAQVDKNYELGSGTKWRYRHLIVDGYVRSKAEQKVFVDLLHEWFDNESFYTVYNHDAGTKAIVESVECMGTSVDFSTAPLSVEPITYQVICNSRLEYIA